MEGKIKIVAALLVLAVIVHWVTRTPPSDLEQNAPAAEADGLEQRGPAELDAQAAELPNEGAAEAAQRTQVETATEEEVEPELPEGSRVLRVVVDGITAEEGQLIEITLNGHEADYRWLSKVQESWQGQGIESHYDLDPFFAAIEERYPDRELADLRVIVALDGRLSASMMIGVDEGQVTESGQTLYEARVEFAPLVFWSEFELTVRDAHTREHLEDVELHMVPSSFMGIWMQPGRSYPYTEIGRGLSSPITAVGGRRSTVMKLRSEGSRCLVSLTTRTPSLSWRNRCPLIAGWSSLLVRRAMHGIRCRSTCLPMPIVRFCSSREHLSACVWAT